MSLKRRGLRKKRAYTPLGRFGRDSKARNAGEEALSCIARLESTIVEIKDLLAEYHSEAISSFIGAKGSRLGHGDGANAAD